MTKRRATIAAMIPAFALATGCSDATSSSSDFASVDGESDDAAAVTRDVRALAGHRVLFAHHSVGRDILAGVALLTPDARAVAIESVAVGKNGDPLGKIGEFERVAIESRDDVVVFKLCFADFTPFTDVPRLVDAYRASVERIRAARPGVVIVHTTPALFVRPTDVRVRIKRALHRPVWGDDANARRAAYADAIRATFRGEPLFDLARIESTSTATTGADAVPSLLPAYSLDGGHLNDRGKRRAARAFLDALAAAVTR